MGKVCQTVSPESAKKSTKRRASCPRSPLPTPPGNEVMCSRAPARRRSSMLSTAVKPAPFSIEVHYAISRNLASLTWPIYPQNSNNFRVILFAEHARQHGLARRCDADLFLTVDTRANQNISAKFTVLTAPLACCYGGRWNSCYLSGRSAITARNFRESPARPRRDSHKTAGDLPRGSPR